MAASAPRPPKRGRTARLDHYVGPPAHLLVGARISVFWPDDDAFYKVGRLGRCFGWHRCVLYFRHLGRSWLTAPGGPSTAAPQWVAVQADSVGKVYCHQLYVCGHALGAPARKRATLRAHWMDVMASDPRTDAAGQGRILEALGGAGECRVLYDDDMTERLALPRERFRWLAPRARSAGATPALYVRAPPARRALLDSLGASVRRDLFRLWCCSPCGPVCAPSMGRDQRVCHGSVGWHDAQPFSPAPPGASVLRRVARRRRRWRALAPTTRRLSRPRCRPCRRKLRRQPAAPRSARACPSSGAPAAAGARAWCSRTGRACTRCRPRLHRNAGG